MSAQHTQGRLVVSIDDVHADGQSREMGQLLDASGRDLIWWSAGNGPWIENPADARRLAACWNACEGIDTDMLKPDMLIDTLMQVTDLATERDQLRAELDSMRTAAVQSGEEFDRLRTELHTARVLLLEALPHINPKAAVMALARTGPLSEAYVNTRVRRFLEGEPS